MSLTGKNTLSIRKKDVAEQKSVAVGFKKTQFAHKAAGGETGIDLTSLTLPTEMPGFTNPNTSDLTSANIFFYRKNFTLLSSSKGELIQDLSYTINSSSRINFVGFTADPDEIFVGIIDHNPSTSLQVVDAAPIVAHDSLDIGAVDFNVGVAFQVGQTPQKVAVYRNGLIQVRNTDNSSSVLDGNYYEVDAGDGTGLIVRFNTAPSGQPDSIVVTSIGSLVEKPTASQLQEVERVQGQIDGMIPTLAQLAGVPETDFQAAPNNQDLKAFGDKVLAMSNVQIPINEPEVDISGTVDFVGSTNDVAWTNNTMTVKSQRFGSWQLVRIHVLFSAAPGGGTGDFAWRLPFDIDPSRSIIGNATQFLPASGSTIDSGTTSKTINPYITASGVSNLIKATPDSSGLPLAPTTPFTYVINDAITWTMWVPVTGQADTKSLAELGGF